jgi:LPPG:FO 2-phospho-L-lactate transferase
LALAGGVGGARLAQGLAQILSPAELSVAVNVGDDFEHLGLCISPDIDTVMYTLAGRNNAADGWGRSDESWNFMGALAELGAETWFRLGDRDLAVHVERTHRLRAGERLSGVTASLCERLGVLHPVCPATDDRLRTVVNTAQGELAFQQYFVRLRCEPRVQGFRFDGSASARPSEPLAALLRSGGIEGIVLCPSNPWLSIAPMLAIPELHEFLSGGHSPVVAVSPIVGGCAIKGPAAKIMRELEVEVSALGVARHYGNLVDGWLIDDADAGMQGEIRATGATVAVADTMMTSVQRSREVARQVLDLLKQTTRRR